MPQLQKTLNSIKISIVTEAQHKLEIVKSYFEPVMGICLLTIVFQLFQSHLIFLYSLKN